MRDIALFVEDFAHQQFLDALLKRLQNQYDVPIRLDWRSVRGGHGAVLLELRQYLRDLRRERDTLPDLVVVATDANCQRPAERARELKAVTDTVAVRTVCAVPDPHIERWLLLDSTAFKDVFGRGCDAPDMKCERARYKKMLIDAIRQSGIIPSLGGIEFAEDVVNRMSLDRIKDDSLRQLLDDLQDVFGTWKTRNSHG